MCTHFCPMLSMAHKCISQVQKSLLTFKLTGGSPIQQDWHFKVNFDCSTYTIPLPLHLHHPYFSTSQLKAILIIHVLKLNILVTTLIAFTDIPNSNNGQYLPLASKPPRIQPVLTTTIAFILIHHILSRQ